MSPAKPVHKKVDSALFLALGAAAFFFAMTALPLLRWWCWEYLRPDSSHEHGFLVPFLAGLLLWHRRAALRAVPTTPCVFALLVLVPSLALLVFAVKTEMQAVMSASFLLTLWSGAWFVLGTRWVRAAAFPLLFLAAMAPLPGPLLSDLTLQMQMVSTLGAAKLLALMGLHPLQDGNIIALENYRLHIDVPCSGFKLLLRLLTFSAAFAALSETTRPRQWGIFLFSLPLSVFVNALRIALIGVVGECLGTTAAHTFHDWSGIITTVLCMALLLGFARGLGCTRFAGQRFF